MSPERHDQDSSRSRHSHRSRRDRDDASVDSGYGGSAANSPKDTHDVHRPLDVQKDALRNYHAESAKHHAESSRRSSRSEDAEGGFESKAEKEEWESDSDSDYDPRDKYYLRVDDDEYNKMTSAATEEPAKVDRDRDDADRDRRDRRRSDTSQRHTRERRESTASERDRRERRERRESDASNSSKRSDRERYREKDRDRDRHKSVSSRRQSTTSDGNDSSDRRRRRSSAARSDTSSNLSESRDRKESSRRRNDASTASHSRHDTHYRSLSPIPSDSWEESEDSQERSPRRRRRTSRSRARSERGSEAGSKTSPKRSKSRDESAQHIDPDGEAAKNFLDKLTKGIDMKSVGKVGLDAAAVAAIKIAVGTQIPWKQRIPKTITVGAAAAIMDFIVKKTNFKPKGMIGTIYARQFVEIVLANLIINPVSTKVTGAAQNVKGKATAGGGGRR